MAGCRSLKQAHRDRAAYLQADSDPLLVRSTASFQPFLPLGALRCFLAARVAPYAFNTGLAERGLSGASTLALDISFRGLDGHRVSVVG